jgi:hypothetical protein
MLAQSRCAGAPAASSLRLCFGLSRTVCQLRIGDPFSADEDLFRRKEAATQVKGSLDTVHRSVAR